jgi:hypothetical protein
MRGWLDLRTGPDDVERIKILLILGLELDPSAMQPGTSHYTDCATPAAHPQRDFILTILMDKHFTPFILFFYPYLHLSPSLLCAFRQRIKLLFFFCFRWLGFEHRIATWKLLRRENMTDIGHTFIFVNRFLLCVFRGLFTHRPCVGLSLDWPYINNWLQSTVYATN